MKKILLVIVGMVVLGAAGYYVDRHYISPQKTSSGVAGKEGESPAVTVMEVATRDIALSAEYNGRVSAYKISPVRPQVGGVVRERLFEEGDEIKAGQQLYQIDPAPYLATVNTAKAQLQKAEATSKAQQSKIERYRKLVKMDAISRQDYDDQVAGFAQAQADIAIARAALDTAELNLAYTKVYAPISGKAGFSAVTEGALVTADQEEPLTTITQLDPIYVDFTAQWADMQQIRSAQQGADSSAIKFYIEGSASPDRAGRLQFSDITVDETTGTIKSRLIFENADHALLPQQFVKIRATFPNRSAILLPQSAAIRGPDGGLSVWVITQDHKVKKQPIAAQKTYENQWILESGLQPGDQIVTSGFQKIKDGQVVTVAQDKTQNHAQDQVEKQDPKNAQLITPQISNQPVNPEQKKPNS